MALSPRRILILYWHSRPYQTLRAAIREHLAALESSATPHELLYYNIYEGPPPAWLRHLHFDAVIFHNLALTLRWSDMFQQRKWGFNWIRSLDCAKIAMPQDEYDESETLDEWLYELGVHAIFTNFGPEHRKVLYPIMHDRAEFYQVFTGYVDEPAAASMRDRLVPVKERKVDVVYRAAHLQYWFGTQGQLKHRIASIVKGRADALGLVTDISTRDQDTITGYHWLDFMASSRATIGCESGSTALDRRGELKAHVRHLLAQHPHMTFEEASRLLPPGWDDYRFLAISPRHLEAVTTKTCQILVEGHYDGVLQPNLHYLPLRQDFSNLDSVLEQLRDHEAIQEMVDRAYADVYLSGRYTLRTLASTLESAIEKHQRPRHVLGEIVGAVARRLHHRRPDPRTTERIGMSLDASAQVSPQEATPAASPAGKTPSRKPDPEASRVYTTAEEYLRACRRLLGVSTEVQAGTPGHEAVLAEALWRRSDADAVVVLGHGSWQSASPGWLPLVHPLSRHFPVFIVLPDLDACDVVEEWTDTAALRVLHVDRRHGRRQRGLLDDALRQRGVKRPLLLTDHAGFDRYVATRFTALTVFLAPHQDAADDDGSGQSKVTRKRMQRILGRTDLLVGQTEEELRSLVENHACACRTVVSPPYRAVTDLLPVTGSVRLTGHVRAGEAGTIFVPGPLDDHLDPQMLEYVAQSLPNWEFLLGGDVTDGSFYWDRLRLRENMRFIGDLPVDEAKWHAYNAHVAFLPLSAEAQVVEVRGRILAMWACGLPVVTSPRCDLGHRAHVLAHGETAWTLANACRVNALQRFNAVALAERRALARLVDGCSHSATVLEAMLSALSDVRTAQRTPASPLHVLVAHDAVGQAGSAHVNSLQSFGRHSRHRVSYAQVTAEAGVPVDLSVFDAVVVCETPSLPPLAASPDFVRAFQEFGGYKVLIPCSPSPPLQRARAWDEEVGLHAILAPEAFPEGEIPPRVEFVRAPVAPLDASRGLDSWGLVAGLDAHLHARVRTGARSRHVHGVVGYLDPLDGHVHVSAPWFGRGNSTADLLAGPPGSPGHGREQEAASDGHPADEKVPWGDARHEGLQHEELTGAVQEGGF